MKRKIMLSSLLVVGVLLIVLGVNATSNFNLNRDITVISREAGSGTRGAFVELVGIEEKLPNGQKIDRTTIEAVIANKTDVVLASVASNPYSIGYVSLGSLNNRVKAVKIDGVEASQVNILNGSYKLARPFNIAYKESLSDVAKDFVNFILSAEGQRIVSENYVTVVTDPQSFVSKKPSGKIVVAGSSSVSPLMEKLAEGYLKLNPSANIEIQTSDSTAGMNSVIEGISEIGMASRELKDNELAQLRSSVIAQDGIAVIVNQSNPVDSLSMEQVKKIFIGELISWGILSK